MTRLYLLEPAQVGDGWAPFAGVRPIAELRAGAFRIWERWQRLLDADEVAIVSPSTPRFADVDSRPLADSATITGPAIVARSTAVPIGTSLAMPAGVRGLAIGGITVAWLLGPGESWSGPIEVVDPFEVRGLRLEGTADLITACERLLEDDCQTFAEFGTEGVPDGCVVIGDPSRVIVRTASVEPHVVFDVRKGPIVLDRDSLVRSGARLEGPLYVGPHSWILGGAVRQSVIGPHCRIHGEVSTSVFLGYANKGHDGFLGHSVLGQWVNLGAGTITSNLKNTYGPIRLDLPNGRLETGRTNLGSLIGDHAKTAIGTLLATGTVIGAGANVLSTPGSRCLRPFLWNAGELTTLDGFLTIARRVMPRRGVDVTAEIEASLVALHGRLAR